MSTPIIIPILKDNYSYVIENKDKKALVIDPGEAEPIIRLLDKKKLTLTHILNTHHHGDHIAGNEALKEKYGAKLLGPQAEEDRITGIDVFLREGDVFSFGEIEFQILETPGHTHGHICFYEPQNKWLFSGDTLFLMGCGRLFEGTAGEMWASLQKIMNLPCESKIFCGHEYTLSNAEFCLKIEPENKLLRERFEIIKSIRRQGLPSMGASLQLEKQTNVFLRAGSLEDFAKLRTIKDKT